MSDKQTAQEWVRLTPEDEIEDGCATFYQPTPDAIVVRHLISYGQMEYYADGEISDFLHDMHLTNAELDALIRASGRLAQLAEVKALAGALAELADLMDDVRSGNYKPDTFTTQPARKALRPFTGEAT